VSSRKMLIALAKQHGYTPDNPSLGEWSEGARQVAPRLSPRDFPDHLYPTGPGRISQLTMPLRGGLLN